LVALVLSVRKDLSWRDIQGLMIYSGKPINEAADKSWSRTAMGRLYSHKYGYGAMDAGILIKNAKKWRKVGPWMHESVETNSTQVALKDGQTLSSRFAVNNSAVSVIEHVVLTLTLEHENRGDVKVWLTSPNNITSIMAPGRLLDFSTAGFRNWSFMTVKHWGEKSHGEWQVCIQDKEYNGMQGKLIEWSVDFYGVDRIGEDPNQEIFETIKVATTSTGNSWGSMILIPIIGVLFIILIATRYQGSGLAHRARRMKIQCLQSWQRMRIFASVASTPGRAHNFRSI